MDVKTPTLEGLLPTKSQSNHSNSLKLYFILRFLLFFIFGINQAGPPSSFDPRDIDNYNFINKALNIVKLLLKDIWDFIKGGGEGSKGGTGVPMQQQA